MFTYIYTQQNTYKAHIKKHQKRPNKICTTWGRESPEMIYSELTESVENKMCGVW